MCPGVELGLPQSALPTSHAAGIRARAHSARAQDPLAAGARLVTTDGFRNLSAIRPTAPPTAGSPPADAGTAALKGPCHFSFEELIAASPGQIFIAIPPRALGPSFVERLSALAEAARGRVYLAATFAYRGDERRRLGALADLATRTRAPLVATSDALYHHPVRKPLADVLACIREKCTIADAGFRLEANAERHLKPASEMARLFASYPQAIARTLEIAGRLHFNLEELRYEYPEEPVPPGTSPQAHLEELAWRHAQERYPEGVPAKVRALLEKELALIARLDYARYFLTVYDVVRYARGRRSSARAAARRPTAPCATALGITRRYHLASISVERFISATGAAADIDVDFEHERREEVIPVSLRRYGASARHLRTVIHYRPRMAVGGGPRRWA